MLILTSVSVFIYVNSTFYKVKIVEKRWSVELPLPAKKQYMANETYIDSSVDYLVYTLFYEPDFKREYEYIFLTRSYGNRNAYLYGIFVASSLTMYLCTEVCQYAH